MKNFEAQFTNTAGTTAPNPDYYDKLKFPFLKIPYAFKSCEGAPGPSTAIVLETFSKLPQYTLVLMCNWNCNEHAAWLKKIYTPFKNIVLLDAAASLRETVLLRTNCFVYIHGDKNSSNTLMDAMHSGLPVVAFAEPANKTTTGNKAYYFESTETLTAIIRQKTITDFKKLGAEMQALATGQFAAANYMQTNNTAA